MAKLEVLSMWAPSFPELLVIMVIALLLFGKRLPEVARSLGKGVVEFKKGLKGIEDDSEQAQYQPPKKQLPTDEKSASDAQQQPPRSA